MKNRTVQEKLRGDHIATLELLEKLTKENEKLKACIGKLRKKLKDGNQDKDVEDEDGSEHEGPSNAQLQYELRQSREEVNSLQQTVIKLEQSCMNGKKIN